MCLTTYCFEYINLRFNSYKLYILENYKPRLAICIA